MTILEMMERAGTTETSLSIAWIKDAIHLIQSNSKERLKVSKYDVINAVDSDDNRYLLPADMIALDSVSIKDTSDSKYKKIRRLTSQPGYMVEDTSP
jgi:hypothetical protein